LRLEIIIAIVAVSLFFGANSAFADVIGPAESLFPIFALISIVVVPIALVFFGIILLRRLKPSLGNYIRSNRFIVIGLYFLAEGISWAFLRAITIDPSYSGEGRFGVFFGDVVILAVIPGILLISIGGTKDRLSKISRRIVIVFLILGIGLVLYGAIIDDYALGMPVPFLEEIERLAFCNKFRAMADMAGQSNIDDGCDLSGADLRGVKLYRADLSGADLSGANLYRQNLYGADLSGANLDRADLSGAYLTLADLSGANLSGANLSGAKLSYVDLSGANLSGAKLSSEKLADVNFFGEHLSGANLYGADLSDVNLSGADLDGAYFTDATNQPTGNIDCKGKPIGAEFTCTGEIG